MSTGLCYCYSAHTHGSFRAFPMAVVSKSDLTGQSTYCPQCWLFKMLMHLFIWLFFWNRKLPCSALSWRWQIQQIHAAVGVVTDLALALPLKMANPIWFFHYLPAAIPPMLHKLHGSQLPQMSFSVGLTMCLSEHQPHYVLGIHMNQSK